MSGYINLYSPALRQRTPPVSLAQGAMALAVVLAAMLAWCVQATRSAELDRQAASSIEAQLTRQREQVTGLAREAAARRPSAALTTELQRVNAELAGREAAVAALDGGNLGSTRGFSTTLRALARQSLAGLWLTGFDISQGGAEMAIAGRALRAELLPAYLGRLNGEEAFKGRNFAALSVGVPAPAKREPTDAATASAADYLEFVLASAKASREAEAGR